MKIIVMSLNTQKKMLILLSIFFFTMVVTSNTYSQTTVNLPSACDNCSDPDTDGDGTPNSTDTDDDGDGVADSTDTCPLLYGSPNFSGCPPYGVSSNVPASSGILPAWTPTSSDWSGSVSTGSLSLNISSLQVGQCIDTWPTGVYGVYFHNTTSNPITMKVIGTYHYSPNFSNVSSYAAELVLTSSIAAGTTGHLHDKSYTGYPSSSSYTIFRTTPVTLIGSSAHNQVGSAKCVCRIN